MVLVGEEWCRSAKGMCEPSPDEGRHVWIKIGDGQQSNEWFQCKHCKAIVVD